MIAALEAENLFSFEKLNVSFTNGVTLIEGYNHDDQTEEGAGKSAIPNIVAWVLFGEIPKDAKIDDVIRFGAKNAKGTVLLSNGLSVVRTRKPNDVYMIDGVEGSKIKGKDAKETQQMIEEMLGMSFKTFCQAVYFAQNYPNKFVTATEEDKAKILSEIEDLSQFDRARKETVTRIKTLEPQILMNNRDIQNLEQTQVSLTEHYNGLLQLKGRIVSEKEKELADLNAELSQAKSQLAAIKTYSDNDRKEIETKILQLEQTISLIDKQYTVAEIEWKNRNKLKDSIDYQFAPIMHLKSELRDLNQMVIDLKNPKPGQKCTACGSDLSKADQDTIEGHILDLKDTIEIKTNNLIKLEEKLAKSQEEYQALEDPRVKMSSFTNDSSVLRTEVEKFKKTLYEIQNADYKKSAALLNIESIEKRISQVTVKTLNDFDEKLEIANKKIESTKLDLEQLTVVKTEKAVEISRLEALKDAFKEVKSFAFRNTLLELNYKANDYLSRLFNQDVQIRFYNESEDGEVSKILCEVTIDGDKRPLGLYSGGQFRRIQLAVDLALSDLISSRNKNSINFRILDEYFKDLSETSMENCLHLLQSLKGTTLLVEHNSMFKSIVNQVIRVELKNKISEVIESNHGTETLDLQNLSGTK